MIKLRAIGRCLFFLQSCRTSNYMRSVAMSWFQSDVCVMERLRKKILLKLSVRVVSCDLAPPPQRRRRRHPPPPHHVTFLSLHSRDQRKPTFRYITGLGISSTQLNARPGLMTIPSENAFSGTNYMYVEARRACSWSSCIDV